MSPQGVPFREASYTGIAAFTPPPLIKASRRRFFYNDVLSKLSKRKGPPERKESRRALSRPTAGDETGASPSYGRGEPTPGGRKPPEREDVK